MAKNEMQIPVSIKFEEPLTIKQTGNSSVEIKRNAKGTTEFIVKSYHTDIKEALKEAKTVFNHLCKTYPGE